MTEVQASFDSEVLAVLGPFLERNGFVIDAVQQGEQNELAVVYFRSPECKLQVYSSPRHGEVNCMIGTSDAPTEFGLSENSEGWHFIRELSGRRTEQSIDDWLSKPIDFKTVAEQLEEVRELLESDFEAARTALL